MALDSSLPKPRAEAGFPVALTQRQKAAVIVRLMIDYDALPDLTALSEDHQTALARDISNMRRIDRQTLTGIIDDFSHELNTIALTFPDSMDDTLSALESHLSTNATNALRREAGFGVGGDPWARLGTLNNDRLLSMLQAETPEIAGIALSKIPVARAAELLEMLPGPEARRITFAISRTSEIAPETVLAIGRALVDAQESEPLSAFSDGPVKRVGAILNSSTTATREDVLEGLDNEDRNFAEEVRKAIFTFANIQTRVAARDIPRVLREIEEDTLILALAGAKTTMEPVVEFILESLSRRMADQLRVAIGERENINERDAEAAMTEIIAAIRRMETAGELMLLAPEPEAPAD